MSSFVRDPCGLVCIFVTYISVLYADYVVVRWVVMQTLQDSMWGAVHVVVFNTCVLIVVWSHMKASCSDPGAVPLPHARMDFSDIHSALTQGSGDPVLQDWTVCTRCETYRPPRAHHCRICNRCIKRMDHHCPWINNCVGEKNQEYFVELLVRVGVVAGYGAGLALLSLLRPYPGPHTPENQTRIVHSVVLLVESVLFGIFSVAILYDQINSNETTIEQMQGRQMPLHKICLSRLCRLPPLTQPHSV